MPIHASMKRCQERMPPLIRRFLPQATDQAPLYDAMHYACLNGGKRLRPLLAYLGAELFDSSWDPVDPLALALELIHCYSLIHDDLPAMDNDDLRRGKPTCHKVFGEATAILAGDALLTLAFDLLATSELFPHVKEMHVLRMIKTVAQAAGATGMVYGQALDLGAENQQLNLTQLMQMHGAKTGALLTASVQCGAMMTGLAAEDDLVKLQNFGQAMGVCFQIQDDILDALGNSEIMGKNPGQDVKQNKCTFVTALGLTTAQSHAKQSYEQAISHLTSFGAKAEKLRQLATFILSRVA